MSVNGNVNIEEQLAQYRSRKRKEEYRKTTWRIWEYILVMPNFGSIRPSDNETTSSLNDSCTSSSAENESVISCEQLPSTSNEEKGLRKRPIMTKDSSSSISANESGAQGSFIDRYTMVDWMMLGLKILMWLLLFKVFILIEFGAVYFILSAFVFIWHNMRCEPKKEGEMSAYSVFNPNCEVMDGTFTAEQFERELLHKM